MICPGCETCVFDDPKIPANAYEIHVTVEDADVDQFKKACEGLGFKPVLIEMQSEGGGVFHHLMTSDTVFIDNTRAGMITLIGMAEVRAAALRVEGFNVVRTKIETTLTNPLASDPKRTSGYFESHIEIITPHFLTYWADDYQFTEQEWYEHIQDRVACISNRLHLSRNAFKKNDKSISYFVTIRETDLSWDAYLFDQLVKETVEGLSEFFTIGKVRSEFAWYDTNIDHDRNWKHVA